MHLFKIGKPTVWYFGSNIHIKFWYLGETLGVFLRLTEVNGWLLIPFLAGKWLLPNPLGPRIVTAGSNRSKWFSYCAQKNG